MTGFCFQILHFSVDFLFNTQMLTVFWGQHWLFYTTLNKYIVGQYFVPQGLT